MRPILRVHVIQSILHLQFIICRNTRCNFGKIDTYLTWALNLRLLIYGERKNKRILFNIHHFFALLFDTIVCERWLNVLIICLDHLCSHKQFNTLLYINCYDSNLYMIQDMTRHFTTQDFTLIWISQLYVWLKNWRIKQSHVIKLYYIVAQNNIFKEFLLHPLLWKQGRQV